MTDDSCIPMLPRPLAGVRAVVGTYEAFIVDLWGVVHDGSSMFAQSVATLDKLKAEGVATMFLSNAPRRSWVLVEQLGRMGLKRDLYVDVMSSGEAVWRALCERPKPFFAQLGDAVHHLGREEDRSLFKDADFAFVTVEEADFIVNTGPPVYGRSTADYEAVLRTGVRRGLPMVCANPDRVVVSRGRTIVCAGAFADRYQELGGQVSWHGKPDPAIYQECIERLGVEPRRVAVIGDSLATDMRGAAASGLDGLWVTSGIHAQEVGGGYGSPADPMLAAQLAARHKLAPTALLAGFIW